MCVCVCVMNESQSHVKIFMMIRAGVRKRQYVAVELFVGKMTPEVKMFATLSSEQALLNV